MKPDTKPAIQTGSGADLAFAVVVLTAYFVTFSSIKTASSTDIALMIILGIIYVVVGIYGYGYCARSNNLALHLAYFGIQIPLGAIIIYFGRGSGLNAMVLLPLAAHTVVLLKQGWMYVINLIIVAAYLVAVYAYSSDWVEVWSVIQIFLAGLIFVIVFTTMAIGEEKARNEVERLVSDLETANKQLREYALQAGELATIRERNRLAREIHDGLGHYLTAIHMQLQAARAVYTTSPDQSLKNLETAQNLTSDALEDVRQSVAALRSPSSDESLPLEEQIQKLVDARQTDGVSITFDSLGDVCPLPYQVEQTLFRAVQEGLNNAGKHSNATAITIKLDYTHISVINLVISDNGVGCDTYTTGFGLLGLQERLNLLQGEVKISTSPGAGFTLDITVPI